MTDKQVKKELDRVVESDDFKIDEPANTNIIVDPDTGMKSIKLNEDGCPPGYSWNAKWGRCLKDEENKVQIGLNKDEAQPINVEGEPGQDRPIRRDNNKTVQSG